MANSVSAGVKVKNFLIAIGIVGAIIPTFIYLQKYELVKIFLNDSFWQMFFFQAMILIVYMAGILLPNDPTVKRQTSSSNRTFNMGVIAFAGIILLFNLFELPADLATWSSAVVEGKVVHCRTEVSRYRNGGAKQIATVEFMDAKGVARSEPLEYSACEVNSAVQLALPSGEKPVVLSFSHRYGSLLSALSSLMILVFAGLGLRRVGWS